MPWKKASRCIGPLIGEFCQSILTTLSERDGSSEDQIHAELITLFRRVACANLFWS
jgi:hypothetical protein